MVVGIFAAYTQGQQIGGGDFFYAAHRFALAQSRHSPSRVLTTGTLLACLFRLCSFDRVAATSQFNGVEPMAHLVLNFCD